MRGVKVMALNVVKSRAGFLQRRSTEAMLMSVFLSAWEAMVWMSSSGMSLKVFGEGVMAELDEMVTACESRGQLQAALLLATDAANPHLHRALRQVDPLLGHSRRRKLLKPSPKQSARALALLASGFGAAVGTRDMLPVCCSPFHCFSDSWERAERVRQKSKRTGRVLRHKGRSRCS